MEEGIVHVFTSVSVLQKWLVNKNNECESAEEFSSWLQNYFDEGNEISVRGEKYDYWACMELV